MEGVIEEVLLHAVTATAKPIPDANEATKRKSKQNPPKPRPKWAGKNVIGVVDADVLVRPKPLVLHAKLCGDATGRAT